jgi:hypothetical protein
MTTMDTADTAQQMEAEDLAHAKDLVQMVLRDWDWLTWNDLLADDVVLSIELGAAGINQIGGLVAVGGKLQATGLEDAKRVLKSIYKELRSGLSVTTEIISGYDAALFGNFALRSTKENTEALSLPIVLHMAFDYEGKIEKMTIAALDLQPLIGAIRAAVQKGAGQASA